MELIIRDTKGAKAEAARAPVGRHGTSYASTTTLLTGLQRGSLRTIHLKSHFDTSSSTKI